VDGAKAWRRKEHGRAGESPWKERLEFQRMDAEARGKRSGE
jgi:hypothetical protein